MGPRGNSLASLPSPTRLAFNPSAGASGNTMKHKILNPASAGGQSRLGRSFHCLTLLGLILGASLFAGCAAAPLGPAFAKSEPPPPHRSRVYVYRADTRSSLSRVRASIDGRLLGDLRDGEYETTEMASGAHRLRAGLRGFGLTAWGWNEKKIRLEPGKTLYIQLSVRLEGHEQPAAGALDIAGRTGGSASENVYFQVQGEEAALRELVGTTRTPKTER